MTISRVCSVCDLADLETVTVKTDAGDVAVHRCPICDVRRCAKSACRAPMQERRALCHRCGADVT